MPSAVIIVVGFLTKTVIGAFVLKAGIALAISAAAQALFGPKSQGGGEQQSQLQDRTVTVREALSTRKLIYGEVRVGGTIVFIDTTDDNEFLHIVVAFASHECESFEAFYFDEHELTLTGNEVTAPAKFDGLAHINEHLGSDTQGADADLIAASSLWTSAHRLRGITYAYIKLTYDTTAYASGIPNITALMKGKKVFDPRLGTTAWSTNAALCSADYLLDSRYGLGVPAANIDMLVLTTAADTSDEAVSLKAGGTEDRYACNGRVDTALTPRNIIETMATAKGAATVSMMGTWYVHAGEYRTPDLSFDESDFAGPMQIRSRHPRTALYNHVKGTYSNPDNDWQPADFPVVTSSTYLAEDNNEIIWHETELPFTISPATAQRLGLLDLNRARRQITVTARFKLGALDTIPTDVIQLSVDRMGWASKTFEIQDWRFVVDDKMALGIELTLRETDSAVYTWSTADESAANAAPETNLPDFSVIQAPTGLAVSTYQVPTSDGDETYKALLTWTPPNDAFVLSGGMIEIEYKESADADWLPSWFVAGASDRAHIPLLEKDVQYDVRIRSFNGVAYSSWVSIFGFTVLGSGGVGTQLDYDLFSNSVTTNLDYGLFSDSVTTNTDYGSFT